MNKRIKELMIKSGAFDYYEVNEGVDGDEKPMEKFAELIVQECMDILANADMTELEGPDPEDVLYVACKQVKKHFGAPKCF